MRWNVLIFKIVQNKFGVSITLSKKMSIFLYGELFSRDRQTVINANAFYRAGNSEVTRKQIFINSVIK